MNDKKLFMFDLDGTLVDAYDAITESINFTRQKYGMEKVSLSVVKKNVGRGEELFVETFFPHSDLLVEALATYREHHKQAVVQFSKIKPYAKELLSSLKRKKRIVAIASNRPQLYTELIVDTLNMRKYFDLILCADTVKKHKPDPKILTTIMNKFNIEKEDSVFVGDMDVDMETAHRAGVDAIFTKGGSSTLKEVKQYTNKKIVSSLQEILAL